MAREGEKEEERERRREKRRKERKEREEGRKKRKEREEARKEGREGGRRKEKRKGKERKTTTQVKEALSPEKFYLLSLLSNQFPGPTMYQCQATPGKGPVGHSPIPRLKMIKTVRGRGEADQGFLFCCPFVPVTSPISKDFNSTKG